jgi:hypothetical protein
MNRFPLIDGNAGNFQLKVRFQHGGSRVLPAADYGVEKQVAFGVICREIFPFG